MRILVTDGMDASAVEKLRGDGYEVVEQFYEPEALGGALREFDAVVIGEEYAPGLLQRSGGAGHGAAVLLRAEYLHCRTHHAGGQMGEEGLFQGI